MKPQLIAAYGLAALAPYLARAARFPLKARSRSTQEYGMLRRAQQALFDIADFAYYVELSVADKDYSALIDTGRYDCKQPLCPVLTLTFRAQLGLLDSGTRRRFTNGYRRGIQRCDTLGIY